MPLDLSDEGCRIKYFHGSEAHVPVSSICTGREMCRSCDFSEGFPFGSFIKALVPAVSRRKEGAEVSLNNVSVMPVHLPSGPGNPIS